jgi:hypothetical protein
MTATDKQTPQQRAHVAKVYPDCRDEMREYLRDGVEVGIYVQDEVGESPPYAIYVMKRQDFWIDCCDTYAKAAERAKALGLRVVT